MMRQDLSPSNSIRDDVSSSVTSNQSQATNTIASPPPLDLGWTQVARRQSRGKKRRADNKEGNDNEDAGFCCLDPSCRRRRLVQDASPYAVSSSENPTSSSHEKLSGRAAILLHEPMPQWFQGYIFFRDDSTTETNGNEREGDKSRRPWGFLAEQQEIDECLYCSEGGFRVVNLTFYPPSGTIASGPKTRQAITFPKSIEWTGGDMVRLHSPSSDRDSTSQLSFQPDQILTGKKAIPYVKGIFQGVVKNLDTEDILDVLPDVAVVLGSMNVDLPVKDQTKDVL